MTRAQMLPPAALPYQSSGYAWPYGSYNLDPSPASPYYLPTLWGWAMPYYRTRIWDDRTQFAWGHQQQRGFWPAAPQGRFTGGYRQSTVRMFPVAAPRARVQAGFDANGNWVEGARARARNGIPSQETSDCKPHQQPCAPGFQACVYSAWGGHHVGCRPMRVAGPPPKPVPSPTPTAPVARIPAMPTRPMPRRPQPRPVAQVRPTPAPRPAVRALPTRR